MINQALSEFMFGQRDPMEETLRRVIREELEKYG
jgi:hypothetical protein